MNLRYVFLCTFLTGLTYFLISPSLYGQMECGHFNPKINTLDPVKDVDKINALIQQDELSATKEIVRIKQEVSGSSSINLTYDPDNKLKFFRILQKELDLLASEVDSIVTTAEVESFEDILFNSADAIYDFYDFISDHEKEIRSNNFSFLGINLNHFNSLVKAYHNLEEKVSDSCKEKGTNASECYSLQRYKFKFQDLVQTFEEIIQRVAADEPVLISANNYVQMRSPEHKRIAVVFHYVIDRKEFADQDKDLVEMSQEILDHLNKYFNSTDYFSLYLDGWFPPSPHVLYDDWSTLNAAPHIELSLAKLKIDEDNPGKATPTSGVEVRYIDVPWLGRGAVKRWEKGGLNAWDTKRYLNIWVSNDRDHVYEGGYKLLGSASFPESYYNWTNVDYDYRINDGIWINSQALLPDRQANDGKYYRGKVIHHELGHYLGLFHTHAKGKILEYQNGCELDDGILDTPRTNGIKKYFHNDELMAEGGAPHPCGNNEYEMYHNFMGYSSPFASSFTPQQVKLMEYHLDYQRSGLLELSYFDGQVSNGDSFNGFVGDYHHNQAHIVFDYTEKEEVVFPIDKVSPTLYSCGGPIEVEVSVPTYADRSSHNNRELYIRYLQVTGLSGRVISFSLDPENAKATLYKSNEVHRTYRAQINPNDLSICENENNGMYFITFRLTDRVFGAEYRGHPFAGKIVLQK